MKKNYSRGIGISHASFCYLTNGAQLLSSSAFRFWFQIVFQIILASFVPGLSGTYIRHVRWACLFCFVYNMETLAASRGVTDLYPS